MAKQRDDQDQPKKPGKTPPPPPSDDDVDFFEDEEAVEDALEIVDEDETLEPMTPKPKPEVVEEEGDSTLPPTSAQSLKAQPTKIGKPVQPTMLKKEEPEETEQVLDAVEAEPSGSKPGEVDDLFAEDAEEVVEEPPAPPESGDTDIFADEVLSEEKKAAASPVPSAKKAEAAEVEETVEEAQEADEVAEAIEEAEEATKAEEMTKAEPVTAAAEPTPATEDDIDLNEIFGDEKAEGEKKPEEKAKPVAMADIAINEAAAVAEAKEAQEAEEAEEDKAVAVAVAASPKKVKPAAKPKYFSRWVGGFLLGILTIALAVGALWYFKPDLLADAFHSLPESPNGPNVFKKVVPLEDANVKSALARLEGDKLGLQTEKTQLIMQVQNLAQSTKKLTTEAEAAKKMAAGAKDLITKADADRKKAEADLNQLVKALAAAKLVDAGSKADPAAIAKSVKELAEAKAAVAAVNKRLEDAKIAEQGEKGVEKLLTTIKDAEKQLAELDQILADAKAKSVQELASARKQLEMERNGLDALIKAAFKEMVEAKIVSPSADPRKDLIAGAKAARQRSESPLVSPLTQLASSLGGLATGPASLLERGSNFAALNAELAYYKLREPFVRGPEQKMDMWIAELLEPGRGSPTELATAAREAAWLRSKDSRAGAETRAKALVVAGLVHRNQGRFADALKNLQTAKSEVQANKLAGPWTAQLNKALSGLADPTAYFMPRLETFLSTGNVKGALAELDSAIKALPNDGRLLALRSLIRLDSVAGKMSESLRKQIEEDLSAARKDPQAAAEAAFAQGRLEEELGNLDEAEKLYRQALQTQKGSEDDAARYRIALARLLQRDRSFGVAPPPRKVEPKAAPKKDAEPAKIGQWDEELLRSVLLLAIVGVQQQDEELNPATAARLEESVKLAKELIKSKNSEFKAKGHMLLGTALAKQGRRTEGLKEYIRGLEILTPGVSTQELSKMVEEHPAFQQPDTLARPNPALAEHHFGKGINSYWGKDYAVAEEHFKQAVSYYSQDARYQYFLGLAQLAQKTKLKRDAAYHAFEQGARLEAMNRPPLSDINASLERLQGDMRQFLNSFRSKK